jgi:elongator complex protein 3
MLFANLKTEKDVANLKRKIVRDDSLYGLIVELRRNASQESRRVTPKRIRDMEDGDKKKTPTNGELLALYKKLVDEGLEESRPEVFQILKRLKVRSSSGVAVVSLLTKPYTCPGRCIYCPTEKNMPKSYLSREPAAARALSHRFDPARQIESRLRALSLNGHPLDKIEMIIIGGTFNFYKKEYGEWFVKECFRACNNWRAEEEGREVIKEEHTFSLEDLQVLNESAHARIIGLSIETRPDYITPPEIKWLRYLGVTKVELGVQHLDNKVLEYNKREMTAEQIAEGVEILREYGFKLVYHMMPNLPGSNPEMDVDMFSRLYNGKLHHPDMMKIYPNMVLRGSLLYKLVTQKKIDYAAYDDDTLTRVLADCEKYVPNYTRLIRVIRDIPADYIIVGSKKSNLRESVDAYQKARGVKQVDIRAREIRDAEIDPGDFELTETWYETERGYECFLQFENKESNKIAGFLRLRLPKTPDRDVEVSPLEERVLEKETLKNWGLGAWEKESNEYYQTVIQNSPAGKIDEVLVGAALVRELHVYGTMKRVGEEGTQSQHTGMGKRLLARAEEISLGDNSYNLSYSKIAIISGVGVREYYRKRGYSLEATYMVKNLEK